MQRRYRKTKVIKKLAKTKAFSFCGVDYVMRKMGAIIIRAYELQAEIYWYKVR